MEQREYFMSLLDYDLLSGTFLWKVNKKHNIKAIRVAGSINNEGYRHIVIDKKIYLAHRLAWLLVYGKWPSRQIDHINGNRADNRIENLRSVTNRTNLINSYKHRSRRLAGAHYINDKLKHPWQAQIESDGKHKSLGYYLTEIEAHEAYMEAYNELEKEL